MRRPIPNSVSPEECELFDANLFGPVGQTLVLAIVLDKDAAPTVLHLLRCRSPFAVSWFIVAAYILSFDGMARRAAAHIRKKVFKRRFPSLANRDAKRTIEFICFMVRVSASLSHCRPRPPFWRVSSAVNDSMGKFTRKAATGSRIAGQQVAHPNGRCFATIALAEPIRSSFRAVRKTQGDQPTESLTSQIPKLHSPIISLTTIRRCLSL